MAAKDTVFYIDGAGGGGLLDSSRDVRRGLRDAGLRCDFRTFVWQTGLGAVSDLCASVQYKREKARLLLKEIRVARRTFPHGRIRLIAASAGTAVCVFSLEAMSEGESVDSVILLSSALSSTYDLTAALQHVRGEMFVFTSPHDALLRLSLPILGTCDRAFVAAHAAGLEGFVAPADRHAAYEKVREIRWRTAWKSIGNLGGHTDCKNAAFVRQLIAPLLRSDGSAAFVAAM